MPILQEKKNHKNGPYCLRTEKGLTAKEDLSAKWDQLIRNIDVQLAEMAARVKREGCRGSWAKLSFVLKVLRRGWWEEAFPFGEIWTLS